MRPLPTQVPGPSGLLAHATETVNLEEEDLQLLSGVFPTDLLLLCEEFSHQGGGSTPSQHDILYFSADPFRAAGGEYQRTSRALTAFS